MRTFLYEYSCATGERSLPASLCAEGRAMLAALMEDFGRLAGVEVCTLTAAKPEEPAFRRLARSADWTLLIAPETDNLLWRRCQWVLEEGGRLLGPSPQAVALTGDKLALARHLRQQGIATPPTMPLLSSSVPFPAVCKPRHGAGSQFTFLVNAAEELTRCLAETESVEMVVQPYVRGRAASVAFLVGPAAAVPLPAAEQHLSEDGRFRYLGGLVPLAPALAGRAQRLAGAALATVPGLHGYVGVDLVLGETEDGREDQVIEINPRLTTSYIGLRRLAYTNLAEAMLHVGMGHSPGELEWKQGSICFRTDGTIDERSDERPASAGW
jgi:predicted ATP-grasp superfamily ATP-dependent carboligase